MVSAAHTNTHSNVLQLIGNTAMSFDIGHATNHEAVLVVTPTSRASQTLVSTNAD